MEGSLHHDTTLLDELRATNVRDLLAPVVGAVVLLLAVFLAHDLLVLEGRVRAVEGALDVACLLAAGALFAFRDRVPASHANAIAGLLACLLATNTTVSDAVNEDRILTAHTMLEFVGVGVVLLSRRWFVICLAWIVGGWLLAAILFEPAPGFIDRAVAILAAALVSTSVFFARRRTSQHLATALAAAEGRRRELASALTNAQRALEERDRNDLERRRAETEREELRERLLHAQKMEAIGTLAGGVAHDMNNVLMAIGTMAEALEEELPPGVHREDAQQILVAARRGAEFTRNLLGFSRKGKYRTEQLRVRALVTDVQSLVSRTLPKQVVVRARWEEPDLVVQGDPSQLKHALLNIAVNAAEAMKGAGSLELSVRAVTLSDAQAESFGVAPGPYAEIAVRDDGPGMTDEVKRRAFEPFFTTKAGGRGSGLGLAMVYGALQRHGGSVRIEGGDGAGGTTVLLLLPAVERVSEVPPKSAPRAREGRGVVLVVDDEELVRRGTGRMLKMLGYTPLFAEDGAEALALVQARRAEIDVVLLDLIMPVMSGAQCFRELAASAPDLPVVLCSGYAKDRMTEELLDAGARAFLEKPYTRTSLAAALDEILGARAARREVEGG